MAFRWEVCEGGSWGRGERGGGGGGGGGVGGVGGGLFNDIHTHTYINKQTNITDSQLVTAL